MIKGLSNDHIYAIKTALIVSLMVGHLWLIQCYKNLGSWVVVTMFSGIFLVNILCFYLILINYLFIYLLALYIGFHKKTLKSSFFFFSFDLITCHYKIFSHMMLTMITP